MSSGQRPSGGPSEGSTTQKLPSESPESAAVHTYLGLIDSCVLALSGKSTVFEKPIMEVFTLVNGYLERIKGELANGRAEAFFIDPANAKKQPVAMPGTIAVVRYAEWAEKKIATIETQMAPRAFELIRNRALVAFNLIFSNSAAPEATGPEKACMHAMENAKSIQELRDVVADGRLTDGIAHQILAVITKDESDTETPEIAVPTLLAAFRRDSTEAREKIVVSTVAQSAAFLRASISILSDIKIKRTDGAERKYQVALVDNQAPTLLAGTNDVFAFTLGASGHEIQYELQVRTTKSVATGTEKIHTTIVGITSNDKSAKSYLGGLNRLLKDKPEEVFANKELTCVQYLITIIDHQIEKKEKAFSLEKLVSSISESRRGIGLALASAMTVVALGGAAITAFRHNRSAQSDRTVSSHVSPSSRLTATSSGPVDNSSVSTHAAGPSVIDATTDTSEASYLNPDDVELMDTEVAQTVPVSAMDGGTNDADVPYLDADLAELIESDLPVPNVVAPVVPSVEVVPIVVAPIEVAPVAITLGELKGTFTVAHAYQANAQFAAQEILRTTPGLLPVGMRAETVADYWTSLRAHSPLQNARHNASTGTLNHTAVGHTFRLYQQTDGSFSLVQSTASGLYSRTIHLANFTDGREAAQQEVRAQRVRVRTTILRDAGEGVISQPAASEPVAAPAIVAMRALDAQSTISQKAGDETRYVESNTAEYNKAFNQITAQRHAGTENVYVEPGTAAYHQALATAGASHHKAEAVYMDPSSAAYHAVVTDPNETVWLDVPNAHLLIDNVNRQRPARATFVRRVGSFFSSLFN